MEDVIRLDRCCFSSDWINSLGATGGQNGFPLVEGDPGFLSAGGSEKGLEAFAQRTASSVIVLHCPVLDLLAESYKKYLVILLLWPIQIHTRYRNLFTNSDLFYKIKYNLKKMTELEENTRSQIS